MKKILAVLTAGLILGVSSIAYGGSSTAVNAYINETVPTYFYNYTSGGYNVNAWKYNNNVGMTQTNTGSGTYTYSQTYNGTNSNVSMSGTVGSYNVSGMKGSINFSGASVSVRTR